MPEGWRELLVGAYLELLTLELDRLDAPAAAVPVLWRYWDCAETAWAGAPAGVGARRWREICRAFGQHSRTWRRRLAAVIRCSAVAAEYTACDGSTRYRPVRCGSLFCLRCMRTLRSRHRRIVRAVLRRFHYAPRMLTLTLPSWPRVTGMRRYLVRAFRRFRNLKGGLWQQLVRSAVAAYEHESSDAGAHTHIHAGIDASGFLAWNRLVVEWQQACGCKCKRLHRGPDGPGRRESSGGRQDRSGRSPTNACPDSPQLCAYTNWRIDNAGKKRHERFAWAEADPECPGRYGGMPAPTGVDIRRRDQIAGSLDRELAKYVSKGLTNLARITDPRELAELFAEFWGSQRLVRLGAARDKAITDEIKDPEREQPIHEVCGCACWEFSGIVPWEMAAAAMEKQERGP